MNSSSHFIHVQSHSILLLEYDLDVAMDARERDFAGSVLGTKVALRLVATLFGKVYIVRVRDRGDESGARYRIQIEATLKG